MRRAIALLAETCKVLWAAAYGYWKAIMCHFFWETIFRFRQSLLQAAVARFLPYSGLIWVGNAGFSSSWKRAICVDFAFLLPLRGGLLRKSGAYANTNKSTVRRDVSYLQALFPTILKIRGRSRKRVLEFSNVRGVHKDCVKTAASVAMYIKLAEITALRTLRFRWLF